MITAETDRSTPAPATAQPAQTKPTKTIWDTKTQQYHGGQEWMFLDNFVEDFSVTTNGLGTPERALAAAKDALSVCHHYPPANQEPTKTYLARFLAVDPSDSDSVPSIHSRLLLGNGASELIDLVTRAAPEGPWKPGPWVVQYKEYERSASALGREVLKPSDPRPAALTCIVNPNNPTGDYMSLDEIKQYIADEIPDNSVVMVDESMQPWHSPSFRSDSLVSDPSYASNLYTTRNISLYVIHSWTKLWSCTGLRLGSVVCPTQQHCDAIKKVQVPWSVNVPALKFLEVVTSEGIEAAGGEYLEETWRVTTPWRRDLIEKLKEIAPKEEKSQNGTNGHSNGQHEGEDLVQSCGPWIVRGKPFLSWVWIDFKSETVATRAVALARAAGVPVRPGTDGYKCDTCVRAAVRSPDKVQVLIDAWKGLKEMY
ncbi:hypothetical protein HK102_004320 [Quaeritorhiza haematococci]|nr:hypothetical protein HK102_004320 [Quaeritorhiza haematococci]